MKINSKKFLAFRNLKPTIILLLCLCLGHDVSSQTYPPDINVLTYDFTDYEISELPGYLETTTEALSNNHVTRISDETVFGCDCSQLRHRYAKNRPWNADETLIMTSGSPSKIIDANTYEVLYESYVKAVWSNTDPNYTYDSAANSTFVKKNILTNQTTVLHTFSEYQEVSFGFNEGNLSNDDRWAALIGINGSNKTLIVYDILNDEIVGEKNVGTAPVDWISMSQSGEFVVVSYNSNGSGPTSGIKSFNRQFENEVHLVNGHPHADLGYDMDGNEVLVHDQNISGFYSLGYTRLDNGFKQGLFPYDGQAGKKGIRGTHISTRNINRPGWAYVSVQRGPGDYDQNGYVASGEIFAIRIDQSGIIQRFAKHNSNEEEGYLHQPGGVPNKDGTKVIFASNWHLADYENNSYPPMFVIEVPQETGNVNANAGEDQSICIGETTTLTASGGTDYLWSTGETTQSIQVSPNITTTYSVTVSNSTDSDTDEVVVTVNELPIADAGQDEIICEGESITLTASGGTNYLWSTGETTQSIQVSPNSTTSYLVAVNSSEGCSDTDVVIVTVNSLPNANAGNDVTINEGESITLTASGGTDYLWSTGETTQSIEVSPNTTTTYSVDVTSSQGCSSSDTVTVTVIPETNVVADAGDDQSICVGESTTLAASGGTDYLWSTGETTQSIEVSPNDTTTYTVTVSEGSASDSDDVTVTVNPLPNANAGDDQSICEGESITLTASGGTDYLWSTGETTQSIQVSPDNTTSYIVTVNSAEGCSDTDEVVVAVNSLPSADAGNDVTINEGETTTLTASGGTTYLWSTGETSQSILVSPNETTTYSVEVTSSEGCSSNDDVIVTVIPFTANAGNDEAICDGTSTILTASQGDSYLWSTGETTQSIEVSPNTNTTYTVTITQGNASDTDDVLVVVNDTPDTYIINGDEEITIADGQFITLSADGADSYLWFNGATDPNIAISPSEDILVYVEGFQNDCSSMDEIVIRVVPAVEALVSSTEEQLCLGESIELSASGGENYLWSTGETTQSIIVTPDQDTVYSVLVSDEFSSDEALVSVSVEDCSEVVTSPNENEFEFLISPNPASSYAHIDLSGLYEVSSILVYDLLGKQVYNSNLDNQNGESVRKTIDVSSFNSGLYLVKLKTKDSEITKKLVINR